MFFPLTSKTKYRTHTKLRAKLQRCIFYFYVSDSRHADEENPASETIM
jgi:hypothetical protein